MLADPVAAYDGDPVQAMKSELADQILAAYQRDEPPEVDTAMLSPEIGPARIGVGPGDILITADDFARAPSRWPLFLGPQARAEVRSRRLDVQLARDRSAAYVSDELAWRIPACGRIATIPMRLTALYAHDGDRWVQVFEHLSFARPPAVDDAGLVGRPFETAIESRDLADELSRGIARASGFVADDATLLGPAVSDTWTGPIAFAAVPGLVTEHRRVGLLGRNPRTATIAYWVGNFTMDGGKIRVRGTFVFELRARDATDPPPPIPTAPSDKKRKSAVAWGAEARELQNPCTREGEACRWVLVQAHVSQPIRDKELATKVFGVSLAEPYVPEQPLGVACD